MRLNKYIAQAGLASRRKADGLTKNGNVKVNGAVISTLGYDVKEGDRVEVNGIPIRMAQSLVYYVINKPRGYITTSDDEQDRATVMEFVKDINERIFPVGRLDKDTSGLLIMTNDGDLSYRTTHPRHEIYKTYRAKVKGVISKERIAKLKKGIDIGGFVTSPAKVELIKQAEKYAVVEISIFEGKNRQVRKMFAAVGNKVMELERTAIGEVRLGHLKPGHYRKLTRDEISYLKA